MGIEDYHYRTRKVKDISKHIRIWLETYQTAEEATRAYDEADFLLRGSNTHTNFNARHAIAPSSPISLAIIEYDELLDGSCGLNEERQLSDSLFAMNEDENEDERDRDAQAGVTEVGAVTAADGVENEESLEASVVVGKLAKAVKAEVNDLLTDGVVSLDEVVCQR
ncbi:hypothetical protein PIB30_020362 [Stylosanthes scabra]|uniref:AP2/ERF domain-containing protein n=1 Tax=Stylosanthes scabra TaxID=79078 RepID=A0ABU6Z6W0_9FABA|nr:hypothetical protein [Stylosanthes scabra]